MFGVSGWLGSVGEDALAAMPPAGEPRLSWVDVLAPIDGAGLSDAQLVEELEQLERLTSAAAAAKARLTAELHARRETEGATRGVAHEVALARHESPHRGREHTALALALVHDLPETLAALGRGDISEHAAMIVARESADLPAAERLVLDTTLGPQLTGLGNREITDLTRRTAYDLDPATAEQRARRAAARRRVTCRTLPDAMARVTADLPAFDAVLVMDCLREAAEHARALGDDRTRDQVITDELVNRLAQPVTPSARPLEIQLVMNAEMLLDPDDTTPAHLVGYGPVPAGIAHDLIADTDGEVLIRRLYAHPEDGGLVAMDSQGICFTGRLRRLLFARDGATCRTPYCDAPIRHGDHVIPAAAAPPPPSTAAKGSAKPATTPRRPPAGPTTPPATGPNDIESRSPPPPATTISPRRHPCPYDHATPDDPDRSSWRSTAPSPTSSAEQCRRRVVRPGRRDRGRTRRCREKTRWDGAGAWSADQYWRDDEAMP